MPTSPRIDRWSELTHEGMRAAIPYRAARSSRARMLFCSRVASRKVLVSVLVSIVSSICMIVLFGFLFPDACLLLSAVWLLPSVRRWQSKCQGDLLEIGRDSGRRFAGGCRNNGDY